MLRNYLTVAVRNLFRHKVYSFINITGLSIAIAFCILTFLFVREEWTFDAFHEKADRIYRVYLDDGFGPSGITSCCRVPFGRPLWRHDFRNW